MTSVPPCSTATQQFKWLTILRHGQALHNPRAEAARSNGCSMKEFMDLMRQDDALDATLTELGKRQAQSVSLSGILESLDLIVSSPLSRAIQTADLALNNNNNNYSTAITNNCNNNNKKLDGIPRVCCEHFREVLGEFLNGQRLTKTELMETFPHWNFDLLEQDHDHLWMPTELENPNDVAERGYQGLSWLLKQPQQNILLVSHGGLLRHTMNLHPLVVMKDLRTNNNNNSSGSSTTMTTITTDLDEDFRPVKSRFENCEVRTYRFSWKHHDSEDAEVEESTTLSDEDRLPIVLAQIDPPK